MEHNPKKYRWFKGWMLRGHPSNITRACKRVAVYAHNHGLIVSSTTDGGHAPTSFHFTKPLGRAVDLGHDTTKLSADTGRARKVAFQEFLLKRFGARAFTELFGPDNDLNVKNGVQIGLVEGTALETLHDTHVHVVPAVVLPAPSVKKVVKVLTQRQKDRLLAKKIGKSHALDIIREARRADLPLAVGLALVEKESGFLNQYGHDRLPGHPPIWHGKESTVMVTRDNYKSYLAFRSKTGLPQGVGVTQLTFIPFQQAAEKAGGGHIPKYQCRVGFTVLQANIKAHGLQDGCRRYNGSGPAAEAYGRDMVDRTHKWEARLKEIR
jgi:hypothetical protein